MLYSKINSKKNIIYTINQETIDNELVFKIIKSSNNVKKIGLDMRNVKNVSSSVFIDCLIKNKFKLFNLNSELLTYLAITLKDGYLKTFMSYEDFIENKRELMKRRFLIA